MLTYDQISFGCIPDQEDTRDITYEPAKKLYKIQSKISLANRATMPTVENQYKTGSCSAHARSSLQEFLIKNSNQKNNLYNEISRLHLYYWARVLDNKGKEDDIEDSGCSLRSSCKTITQYGFVSECDINNPENSWPFFPNHINTRPPQSINEAALKEANKTTYLKISNFDDALKCLNEGFPFIASFATFDDAIRESLINLGYIKYPKNPPKPITFHAIFVYGFEKEKFKFINSWGKLYGFGGYGTIDREYFETMNGGDFGWTVRLL